MANRQVERFNRDMRKYLMTILNESSDWALFLKPLQFAHNSAINKSTNFTPHNLTFLQNPRLPDTLDSKKIVYNESYSSEAFKRMQYAHCLVYQNNKEACKAYTANYNKKIRTRKFELEDEVLVTFPVSPKIANKKLSPVWRGPFKIINFLPNNVFELKLTPRSKSLKIHINRCRLFNHLEDIKVDLQTEEDSGIESEEEQTKIRHVRFDDEDDSDDDEGDPDDDDEGDPDNIDNEGDPNPAPAPAPLPAPAPPAPLGGVDRLTVDLVDRLTWSRGPAPNIVLPNRAIEYKKYTKK